MMETKGLDIHGVEIRTDQLKKIEKHKERLALMHEFCDMLEMEYPS